MSPDTPEGVAAGASLIALLTNTPDVLEFGGGVVLVGDCLHRLRQLPDASVDSVVTDPPYLIGFMGKGWDAADGIAGQPEVWAECLRVLKPGGHLLAFGATRTYHRMTVAIEDAGFEIRDSLHWVYGSGFPKSLDVSKAIDKAAGKERETRSETRIGETGYDKEMPQVRARRCDGCSKTVGGTKNHCQCPADNGPQTDAARQWSGWGTALKPAHEPIVVARKPLIGTVAGNVLAHGTGALNIDGCRVGLADGEDPSDLGGGTFGGSFGNGKEAPKSGHKEGRWPANLVFTHAADCGDECVAGCPVAELDGQSGVRTSGLMKAGTKTQGYDGPSMGEWKPGEVRNDTYADTGGASRFFTVTEWDPIADVAPFRYVAKPSKKERNAGLDGVPVKGKVYNGTSATPAGKAPGSVEDKFSTAPQSNIHPTVKAVALMRWLVRLVTPPGGVVLDPFAGSGTTLVAATLEGFQFIGCEMTADYLPIIAGRVAWAEGEAAAQAPQLPLEDAA